MHTQICIPSVDENVEKWELSYTAGDTENWHLLQIVQHCMLKSTCFAVILLSVNSQQKCVGIGTKTLTGIIITVFTDNM